MYGKGQIRMSFQVLDQRTGVPFKEEILIYLEHVMFSLWRSDKILDCTGDFGCIICSVWCTGIRLSLRAGAAGSAARLRCPKSLLYQKVSGPTSVPPFIGTERSECDRKHFPAHRYAGQSYDARYQTAIAAIVRSVAARYHSFRDMRGARRVNLCASGDLRVQGSSARLHDDSLVTSPV